VVRKTREIPAPWKRSADVKERRDLCDDGTLVEEDWSLKEFSVTSQIPVSVEVEFVVGSALEDDS